MLPSKSRHLTLALGLILASSLARAASACDDPVLQRQSQDVATIVRLENAWSLAYLRGDPDFERCLLMPDFAEIMASGEIKSLGDELAMAERNRGKSLAIPPLPAPTVLLHGSVAVGYGTSRSTGPDGKPRVKLYADYYVWENGEWHAFFAQQTRVQGD
jgi:hypothetical protein